MWQSTNNPPRVDRIFALSAFCILVLAIQSCGGQGRKTSIATRAAIESTQPALRWVPANAPYLVVGKGADIAIPWIERATNILGEFGLDVQGSAELNLVLDQSFSSGLGLNLDWQGSAALFGDADSLTAIVPLLANSKSTDFAATMIERGAREISHKSLQVLQGQSPIGQWATVVIEGNLAFHVDLGINQDSSLGWLDGMLAAGSDPSQAYGGSENAKRILGTLASADPMYWGSALGLVRNLQQGEWASCASFLSGIEGLSFHADASEKSVDIVIRAQLSAELVASVRAVQSQGPSAGMQSLGAKAGVALSVGMDISKMEQSLRSSGCSGLADPLAELLRQSPWRPVPRSFHMAGSRFNPTELSGDIAAEVMMANSDFITSLLDQIPGRSWLESRKTIGGEKVKKLSVPTMSSVFYQLQDTLFRFTNQQSAMEMLISQPTSSTQDLTAITIRPAQIPQLERLLSMALPPGFASFAATHLASLDKASLGMHMESNTLSLRISIAGK